MSARRSLLGSARRSARRRCPDADARAPGTGHFQTGGERSGQAPTGGHEASGDTWGQEALASVAQSKCPAYQAQVEALQGLVHGIELAGEDMECTFMASAAMAAISLEEIVEGGGVDGFGDDLGSAPVRRRGRNRGRAGRGP